MAFLSVVHFLTGWHWKFRPNTEGTQGRDDCVRAMLTMNPATALMDVTQR
jgi:hypothetical protein